MYLGGQVARGRCVGVGAGFSVVVVVVVIGDLIRVLTVEVDVVDGGNGGEIGGGGNKRLMSTGWVPVASKLEALL